MSVKDVIKKTAPMPIWKLLVNGRKKYQYTLRKILSKFSISYPTSHKGYRWEFPVTSDTIRDYISNPHNRKKYAFARVCRTICCSDADYIPKVENAGSIVETEGKKVQIMHNGVKIYHQSYSEDPERVDTGLNGQWTSDIIRMLRGHHEPQEEKAFYEVLKDIPESGVMLELGCWWAYYSMWFNHTVPGAKNYLIEPNEQNLNFGKANFALNGMKGDFSYGFLGEKFDNSSTGIDSEAPIISIDAFMKQKQIDFIDILHSDIQGGEYKMLLDAQKALKAHKVRYIFISTHGNKIHAKCLLQLKQYDYHIVCEHTPSQGCSGDGLIVARASSYPGVDHIAIRKYNYNWSDWRVHGVE